MRLNNFNFYNELNIHYDTESDYYKVELFFKHRPVCIFIQLFIGCK